MDLYAELNVKAANEAIAKDAYEGSWGMEDELPPPYVDPLVVAKAVEHATGIDGTEEM